MHHARPILLALAAALFLVSLVTQSRSYFALGLVVLGASFLAGV